MLVLLAASPAAAQQLVSRHSFDSPIAGPEWSARQVSTTPTGRRFLGRFSNDDSVDLNLTLPAGTSSITVSFDLFVIQSWEGNGDGCSCESDRWGMSIDGVNQIQTTFSNTVGNSQQYPGPAGSSYPARTGAFEIDNSAFRVDVYRFVVRLPIGAGTHTVSFFGQGLGGGDGESWGLDNVEVRAAVGQTLAAWGRNDRGQLGDGTTTNRTIPVVARLADGSALSNVIAVTGDFRHTIALRLDGTVWAWGENFNGQLGDGTTGGKLNPVQVRLASGPLTDVVAIAAGNVHSVALRSDGTVWTWGWNVNGPLGDGTTTQRLNPVQARFPDGSPLGGIVAVTAGTYSTVALGADGTIWAWGHNFAGQLGDGTNTNRLNPVQARWTAGGNPISGMVGISAGSSHTVALRSDGTVWAWGSNFSGQLGDGTTTDRMSPVQVRQVGGSGLMTDAVAIAAGMFHSLAIGADGSVRAWGHNASGQIGNGTTSLALTPTTVRLADGTTLTDVADVTAGEPQTTALLADGTVWMWGSNQYGQLGDGTFADRLNPVQVTLAQGGFASGASIGSGRYHSFSIAALVPAASLSPATLDFGELAVGSTSPSRSVTLTNNSLLDFSILSAEIPAVPIEFAISGSTCSVASVLAPGASCTIDVTLTPSAIGPLSATLLISTTGIGSPYTVPLTGSGVSLLRINVSPITTASEGTPFIVTGFVSVDVLRHLISLDADLDNDGVFDQAISLGAYDTFSLEHQYADNGKFGISLTAVDDQGRSTTRLVIVPVANVKPTIAPVGDRPVPAGVPFALAGSFVDPGADSWIGTIDYGDGTVEPLDILPADRSFRTSPPHTYAVAGTAYTATIRVTDDDGETGVHQFTIAVVRAPTETILMVPPGGSRLGQVVRLTANVIGADAAGVDAVEFFDGSVLLGTASTPPAGHGTQVSLLVGTLRLGTHEVSARYRGSARREPSTSPVVSHVVTAESGAARAWGWNIAGQLGDGTQWSNGMPVQVQGLLDNVVATAAGWGHSLALKADGTVWAWGSDGYGQLGDGGGVARTAPVQVAALSDVVAIAAGSQHSLALKADGTVWAWGYNGAGQLGTGTYGNDYFPKQVFGLGTPPIAAAAITAGGSQSMVLLADGSVFTWGVNQSGALGIGSTVPAVPSPQAIPSGLPTGLIVEIAAGGGHTLARSVSGDVYAWGDNASGQLGDGTTTNRFLPVLTGLRGVRAIVAGGNHSLALLPDGTVRAWGANDRGQLGNGVYGNSSSPVDPGLSGIVAIGGGLFHSLALKSDGSVWAWGNNGQSQIGDGTWSDRRVPTLTRITRVVALASGPLAWHTVAISPLTTATVEPANLSFGRRFVGTASPAQTVSMTNTGSLPLGVRPILTGGWPSEYAIAREDCSTSDVPPGGTCTVDVVFGPLVHVRPAGFPSPTERPSTLSLVANVEAPATVALTGMAFTDDTTPVTTATVSPDPNAAGWHNAAILTSTNGIVTVTLGATDEAGGSGVDLIAYMINGAAPTVVSGSSAVVTVFTQGNTVIAYRASDKEGNAESAQTLTLNIDTTAPTVSVTSPTAGAAYPLDQLVFADYACSDLGSGMASCFGDSPVGQSINTSAPGVRIFQVRATDLAGNTPSFYVAYTVDKATGSVTLAADRLASASGEVVRFTATIAAPAGVTKRPGGTVEFFSGKTSIGIVAIPPTGPSIAVLQTFDLPVGRHAITARYAGDDYFDGADAEAITHEVAPQPRTYVVRDVGSLGGSETSASGINSSGQVIGQSSLADGSTHAFLFAGGKSRDLGALEEGAPSWAIGLNDASLVVGQSYARQSSDGPWLLRAFVFANGTMTDLGTLGGTSASARAINRAGSIVGSAAVAGDAASHAFAYANGSMTDLGTLGGDESGASSINDAGDIVGFSYVNTIAKGCQIPSSHAFVRRAGVMTDLGTLGGCVSYASDINAAGQIAGYADANAPGAGTAYHAFVYQDGVMTDLGTLGGGDSLATAINNRGDVVGYGKTNNYGARAFLYRNGVMTDLNALLPADSGWVLDYAADINDAGFIVGHGRLGGESRGFVLMPGVPTVLTVAPASGGYGGTATVTATLTAGGSPLSGIKVSFDIDGDGNLEHSFPTDANGIAAVVDLRLDGWNAGEYIGRVTAIFAGNEEYLGSSGVGDLTVTKAVPQITWDQPAPVVYNAPLDVARLNATTSVPGELTYSPSAGTVLDAGLGQTLSVSFAPTDTLNYTEASLSVLIDVLPAPFATPTNLVATSPAAGQVALTWSDNSGNETRFEIAQDNSLAVVRALAADVTTTSFTGLDSGTSYRWYVRACGPAGCSIWFGPVGKTPDGSDRLAVAVVGPNGGEKVFVGVPTLARWTVNGAAIVDVEFSRNGGTTFGFIPGCTGLSGTTTSCSWTPSGPSTTNARIRVTARDAATGTVADTSDAAFTVSSAVPTITVNAPNTAVNWTIGTTKNITWSHNLGASSFGRVELSRDAGANWEVLAESLQNATASSGSFPWVVTGPATVSALARITAVDTPASDVSNVSFAIVSPSIKVTAPNTGVSWQIGDIRNVGFSHNLAAGFDMNIDVSRDAGATWSNIATVTTTGSATFSYPWLVTGPPSSQALIRIAMAAQPVVSDVSDTTFTLAPSVKVTAPNTAVTWGAGSKRTVSWTHNLAAAETVNIEFSGNGGATWLPLALGVANATATTGTVTVGLPTLTTAQGVIRVSPTARPADGDVSNVPITLVEPTLSVTAPNTNASWTVGTVRSIKWSHNLGVRESALIELSRDGGTTWETLAVDVANTTNTSGTFDWTVTGPATTSARVRVTWAADTRLQDESNVSFRIQ